MGKIKRKARKMSAATMPTIGPTPEQRPYFVTASLRSEEMTVKMVYRRVPVIDQMLERGDILDREHKALAHYRDQAHLAERSPVKSCLDDSKSGGGSGGQTLSAAVTSAMLTTARIERDLGSLRDIARAVAVLDHSLSQWCIAKHGGRERYGKKGEFVAMVPVAEKKNMDIARQDLRQAAHRITP